MMKKSYLVDFTEWALIGLMGLCAVLAFSHSNAGVWLQELIANKYPEFGLMFPWVLWLLLFIAGTLLVSLAGSSGRYCWLVIIFSLPSLLGFDSIKILKIVHVDLPLTTTLTFVQALVMGIVIMTGYILLNRFCFFRQERNSFKKRRAGKEDIETAYWGNYLWVWCVIGVSILIVAVVAFLSMGLSSVLLSPLSKIPWNIITAGIICILVLAFYLYWLGLRRNSG
jgi:hypothetical protein